jgi:hypothetical protein
MPQGDQLTTSAMVSGEETDVAKDKTATTTAEPSQQAVDNQFHAEATVGDATDWNHTEGEADPLVDPYAAGNEAQAKADAETKAAAEKAATGEK